MYQWGISEKGNIEYLPNLLKHDVLRKKNRRSKLRVLQVASGVDHSIALILESGMIDKHYEKNREHRIFKVVGKNVNIEVDKSDINMKNKSFWYKTKVITWGLHDGRLGIKSSRTSFAPPTEINSGLFDARRFDDTQIVSIESGTRHSAAIDSEGKLYMWGVTANHRCATTHEPTGMLSYPTWVSALRGWYVHQVSLGDSHTIAIASKRNFCNQVFVWGRNSQGRLGLGDTIDRHSPTPVKEVNSIEGAYATCIAAGGAHSLTLVRCSNESTVLFSWGSNRDGQLGLMREKKIDDDKSSTTLYETRPQRVHCYDAESNVYLKFVYVTAGQRHTLGVVDTKNRKNIQSNTALYAWGNNKDGQLGTGDRHNRDSFFRG
mgnify:CR=1 FL=1